MKKRNLFQRVSAYFKTERGYEAAQLYATSDWSTASRGSGNTETRAALAITRDRSRDLTRNNPYANKAVNVIVSNTVGPGIVPKIKGRTKSQEKALTKKWKEWGETTACDKDGFFNFYGMQAAALRCIVESGEVLAKKTVSIDKLQLQLLEPDFINASLINTLNNIQGLWVNDDGQVVAYELYKSHPGEYSRVNLTSITVPANQIIHTRRIERLGQLRGMPWAAPVANAIKDFGDYQNSTLIRQKVAACYTAFITEEANASLSASDLKLQRELDNTMTPAGVRYLNPGSTVTLASPPGVDQYDPFARQTLRSIAAGYGISYESLTGDYSNVNFSSGRMGHLEMQRNIDMWRWQMLIPQFCEPAFQWFLNHCEISGVPIDGVTVQWTCPAREMINPAQEIASLKDEVRSGFKTLPEAIRERGLDPEHILEETAEFNQKMDDLGIVFDSDARRVTAQGMTQPVPSSPNGDTTSGNKSEANASDIPSQS